MMNDPNSSRFDQKSAVAGSLDRSILVVDDEPLVRWSIMTTLQKAGYQVVTASTVEDATMALRRGSFNLVITDMKLPDETGLNLAAQVKETTPPCPVIMISAFGDEGSKQRAREIGVDLFVDKPINLAEMLWTVQRIMR